MHYMAKYLPWVPTPWYLTLFGKKSQRRMVYRFARGQLVDICWEYKDGL